MEEEGEAPSFGIPEARFELDERERHLVAFGVEEMDSLGYGFRPHRMREMDVEAEEVLWNLGRGRIDGLDAGPLLGIARGHAEGDLPVPETAAVGESGGEREARSEANGVALDDVVAQDGRSVGIRARDADRKELRPIPGRLGVRQENRSEVLAPRIALEPQGGGDGLLRRASRETGEAKSE